MSYKVLYFLVIACHVCYPSEAARAPPTNTTASQDAGKGAISSRTTVAIVVSISVAVLILIIGISSWIKRLRKMYDSFSYGESSRIIRYGVSLQYDFSTIKAATNNFSKYNKVGEGGFGEVYKGMLPNGQEIAVKRLSRRSCQGVEEFKNEVELLAKLQHQNFVSLLGFCVQGKEKILVLEYVPNKSLDIILFDLEKRKQLDWAKCHKIIKGIAAGMHYLHEDSRLRIIHRDLKASNVLLDSDMNPKISDFGLGVFFTVDQFQGDADCIVGTYGYMSPEYLMDAKFSIKSDVYSFGVLLMEIITGKRNRYGQNHDKSLMSYAWRLWKDGKALELLNPSIRESCNPNEAMRCIHISLLCLQEDPALRPSMSSILIMLESYSLTIPTPLQPAFYKEED